MPRIAIVGAGVGGLATAHALRSKGFTNIRVIERASREAAGSLSGFGFSLAPNGCAVLARLGLYDRVERIANPLTTMLSVSPTYGEGSPAAADLTFLSRNFGYNLNAVARGPLVQLLADTLPGDGSIQWGRTVRGVTISSDGCTAKVATVPSTSMKPSLPGADSTVGGPVTEEEFDCVIGADGLHSTCREVVYGTASAPAFSGTNLIFGVTNEPLSAAAAAHPLLAPATLVELYGHGAACIAYELESTYAPFVSRSTISGGRASRHLWAVCYRSPTPVTPSETWNSAASASALDAVIASQPSWRSPTSIPRVLAAHTVHSTVSHAAPSTADGGDDAAHLPMAHFGLFYRPPHAPWSRGPLVLLGDAAHATLPHLGQGANMALDDAYALSEELERTLRSPAAITTRGAATTASSRAAAIAAAFAAFERRRLAKTHSVVKLSKLVGDYQIAVSHPAAVWVRDRVVRYLFSSGQMLKQLAAEVSRDAVIPWDSMRKGPEGRGGTALRAMEWRFERGSESS